MFNGIESVRQNGQHRENYELRESEDGRHYFVLKSPGNHEIILKGSLKNAEHQVHTAIEQCMEFCEFAKEVDKMNG